MKQRGGNLGGLIRARRLQLGLTQKELARRAGMPENYVSLVETNARRWPEDYVPGLARALGVSEAVMARAAGLISEVPAAGESAPPFPPDDGRAAIVAALRALTDAEKQGIVLDLVESLVRRQGGGAGG